MPNKKQLAAINKLTVHYVCKNHAGTHKLNYCTVSVLPSKIEVKSQPKHSRCKMLQESKKAMLKKM